jgi:hypothetical protein
MNTSSRNHAGITAGFRLSSGAVRILLLRSGAIMRSPLTRKGHKRHVPMDADSAGTICKKRAVP